MAGPRGVAVTGDCFRRRLCLCGGRKDKVRFQMLVTGVPCPAPADEGENEGEGQRIEQPEEHRPARQRGARAAASVVYAGVGGWTKHTDSVRQKSEKMQERNWEIPDLPACGRCAKIEPDL